MRKDVRIWIWIIPTAILWAVLMAAQLNVSVSLLPGNIAGYPGGQTTLEAAVKECVIWDTENFTLGDSGKTLTVDGDAVISNIACILSELDTPDSVISQIDSTRAIDGRQEAEWNGFSASWTYHPDNGLNMIIQEK